MSAAGNAPARTRAITSTLAARSAPTVPPASQAYEPLVKSVLRQRLLYNIFAYSAAFSLATHVLFSSGGSVGVFMRLVSPGTWVLAAMTWVATVLPVIVVRKACLTASPTPAASPSVVLRNAFAKPSTQRVLAVYIASALLLASLNLGTAYTSSSEDLRLSVFVNSKKHPYYFNGRFIFLVLAQVWLAATYLLRNVMLDRFVFAWTKGSLTSNLPHSPRNLPKIMLTIMLFTAFSLILYNITFGLTRLFILPVLFRLPVIRSLLRPFTSHFLRGAWTLTLPMRHFSLELHTFTLGLSTLASWEFAEALFDVYIPQPIKAANSSADPNVTLISGISSSDITFLHFAYAELRDLKSSAQRTALFGDQKYSPSLWSTLVRESLLRLGADYQTFLRRGKPPVVVAGAPAAPAKPANPPSTPLIRQAIYKPPQQSPIGSVLDSFASDSQLAGAADQIHVPELFRSVAAPLAAVTASTPAVSAPKPTVHSMIGRVKQEAWGFAARYCPPWAKEASAHWADWWSRERVNKIVESCLPNRDLDALIVEVLSQLVCASLTEDRYGVVQRDIPRIIEAFLSFLTAIEEYQVEVNALYVPPSPDELSGDVKILEEKERKRVEVARSAEVFGVVADALKTGISDIVRTFGDKLVAFKFPPRTARKLQSFVDYH
ncbi:hypothetical protein BV22DRAFT_1057443 [Leucogyrophana mollusca]|uniref:Uncharacterized protein n=1 Tax=Leucogyrophana mollusca TaxID=85980 RepID=A0ACB8BUM7_9AGAM|nr:hypothetical protein BV22DRAFT_1057443 [Leucogyrophana mollusca]